MDLKVHKPIETAAQVTVSELLGWVKAEQDAVATAQGSTTARFEMIVSTMVQYEPSVAFGLLSDAVRETKPKDSTGAFVKGGLADPAVQTRMSELRQIIGAIQGGWDQWPQMVRRGREAAVTEAREWLKGFRPVRQEDGTIKRELIAEPMTAKGEPRSVVEKRQQRRKLIRAQNALIDDPDEGIALSDEQREELESGANLALVLTPEQQAKLKAKASIKVEQDKIAAAIKRWEGRGEKFVDEMLADGMGEEAILATFEKMKARALAVMRGETAPV